MLINKNKKRGYGVGGLWDEIGKLQFDFMVNKGLRPEHYLLDIGCGALRGGVHFIKYLEPSHYYGFDNREKALKAAREIEIPEYKLEDKDAKLFNIGDFDISGLDVSFDFMLAQSVFTHLKKESIELCLSRVAKKLKPEGVFYATFFEIEMRELDLMGHVRGARFSYEIMKRMADECGLVCDYIGKWNHPREQRMLAFKLKGERS